jgi:hypothetical protein
MIKLFGRSQIITKDEKLMFYREGCVKFVDGKPVKTGVTNFWVAGNVQPLNGRELLLVPENDRFKEQYWVWTMDDVQVNDRVVRCGVNFQVQVVQSWGSYNQARIMRIDVGPYGTNP